MKRRFLSLLAAFAMVIAMLPASAMAVYADEELTIVTQPEDADCRIGEIAEFTVEAGGGTEPYTYQWQYIYCDVDDWIDFSDKDEWASSWDTDTLEVEITKEDYDLGYMYRCVITDAAGDSVDTWEVWANIMRPEGQLGIDGEPQDAECSVGDEIEFTVEVSGGTEPYTYQWQYTCNGLEDWVDFTEEEKWASGWDTDTLKKKATWDDFDLDYMYRCVITDAAGDSVTSWEVWAIDEKGLYLTVTPEDVVCNVGDIIDFNVEVGGGTGEYTYTWEYIYDGCDEWQSFTEDDDWASGWDTDTLTIEVTEEDFEYGYEYRCVITDEEYRSVETWSVWAIEEGSLTIEQWPEDVECKAGDKVEFSVGVSGGTAPYEYYWMYTNNEMEDWVDLTEDEKWASGWDTDTLTVKVSQEHFDLEYCYSCIIVDAEGDAIYTGPVWADEKSTSGLCAKGGHDYIQSAVIEEVTCTEDGIVEMTCSNCGDSYKKHITSPGHIYGGWTIVKEATETEPGEKVRVCSVCEDEDKIIIPAHSGDIVWGNANDDSKVNVKDAVLVLQYANKKIDADKLNVDACDVNGDGKVNVKDATMILQYVNKKIDGFPVE